MKLLAAAVVVFCSTPVWSQSFEAPAQPGPFTPRSVPASDRAKWALNATVGPIPLFYTPFESAIQTWTNVPKQYGTHWDGFGKRVASKFATSALSNTMEASIGSLWGEDPRYHRLGEGSKGRRLKNALKMSFMADNASGGIRPAYARLIAIPTSRWISNQWRPDEEVTPTSTTIRIGMGFVKKVVGNTFSEFWPDIRRHVLHRN